MTDTPPADNAAVNDPLLNLTNPGALADFKIPKLSMRSIMLLEKVDSPFIRSRAPVLNPNTGEPILDPETHMPKLDPIIPTMEEVVGAFYILINEERPDILDLINDNEGWERTIYAFASTLDIQTVKEISRNLSEQMKALNEAASSLPDKGSPAKKATGPTPISECSSPNAVEVQSELKSG